jgi:hypothetical protein
MGNLLTHFNSKDLRSISLYVHGWEPYEEYIDEEKSLSYNLFLDTFSNNISFYRRDRMRERFDYMIVVFQCFVKLLDKDVITNQKIYAEFMYENSKTIFPKELTKIIIDYTVTDAKGLKDKLLGLLKKYKLDI